MLVLTRKKNEAIVINDNITVTIVEIRGDKVRLGIAAPKETPVHRREVYDAICRRLGTAGPGKGRLSTAEEIRMELERRKTPPDANPAKEDYPIKPGLTINLANCGDVQPHTCGDLMPEDRDPAQTRAAIDQALAKQRQANGAFPVIATPKQRAAGYSPPAAKPGILPGDEDPPPPEMGRDAAD